LDLNFTKFSASSQKGCLILMEKIQHHLGWQLPKARWQGNP